MWNSRTKLHGYREVKCQSETVSWEGEYELALKFGYCESSVKKMWAETEGLMFLFWSALFVGGRVVRWEGWGYGMARWES